MLDQYITQINQQSRSKLMAIAYHAPDWFVDRIVADVNRQAASPNARTVDPDLDTQVVIERAVALMAKDTKAQDDWLDEQERNDQFYRDLESGCETSWQDFMDQDKPFSPDDNVTPIRQPTPPEVEQAIVNISRRQAL